MTSFTYRAALCSAFAMGCSPSVATLVQQQKWDAAVCAIHSENDARVAMPAIAEASKARFRVRDVSRAELGVDDAKFFAHHGLVSIDSRYDAHEEHGHVSAWVDRSTPADSLHAFTNITAESVPPAHDERRTVLSEHAASIAGWAVLTVGLSLLVDDRPFTRTATVSVPPTPEEIAKTAPSASALFAAVSSMSQPDTKTFIVPNGSNRTATAVMSVRSSDSDGDSCEAEIAYRDIAVANGDWEVLSNHPWSTIRVVRIGHDAIVVSR